LETRNWEEGWDFAEIKCYEFDASVYFIGRDLTKLVGSQLWKRFQDFVEDHW
jgi:hypothetical protein